MSNINKAAVLNPFTDLTANILEYVPRATTSEFGIVAIGSGINVDNLGRIYLDTQEYSDRLTAIEAQAASNLATQQTEVAAAIAQVKLAQSQTITALTLEVSNLKTDLTNSITATQTDLINRADQLAQEVTDITDQLTQDKAAFTQEIQDALVYLENAESVASALRTPRKIQGVDFDGTQDISLPVFTTQTDGLVPKRVGTTTTQYLREDGTWVRPPDTTYPLLTEAIAKGGTATNANTISAKVLKDAIQYHAPPVTSITGNAGTATKLQTPRAINGVLFDGTQNISLPVPEAYSLPIASASVLGGIKVGSGLDISNSVLSVDTLNQSTTGNAATATKLQTARTINGVDFDGSVNITLPLASTSVSGTVQLNNTLTSTNTGHALTAAQGKVLNESKLGKSENAVSASKLATARMISLTGGVTGSVSFDGSANASITTAITGLGVANGIATLDSSGQVPSTQLPSYVDDVLEYLNVAAFPTTGEAGKIYVETTGNTTYRWSGSGYVKITSGEVSSVAGKTGVVTLTKVDVGLGNINNTSDIDKPVSTAQAAAIDTSASNLTILIKDSLRQSVEVASGGEQTVLYTAKGKPTYMNIIKKFDLSTIDASLSGTHPAFIVNGVEKPEIFVGTYLGKLVDGELLSLPNVDPQASINFDNFSTYVRACGAGHHLMTNAEWSAVALQCYKNDTQPLGNTYYGRSSENPLLIGRRQDGLDAGNTAGTARTLTGSGPVEWRHNRKPSGIADLSGNVWEWSAGMRIFNGEIQVIADNNAALHTIDMSATSAQWKAIDAVTGNLATPDGNGTTAGTVKFANSSTADYTINGTSFGAIRNLSTTKPVSSAALARLKALCLYPVVEDTAKFNGDGLWKTIDAVERTLIRGGNWGSAANAGVFALNLNNARSNTPTNIGARPAFVNL